MTPIQQLMLGVGNAAKKTYMDDVFSTHLYEGNATARNINNGLDLGADGGLVWFKNRDDGYDHYLIDSVRGKNSYLVSNSTAAQVTPASNDSNYNQMITSFNSNGFSLGTSAIGNTNNDDTSSWTFRKAPGFFDVVTWTGNGVQGRDIPHSLGSVPGLILVKRTDGVEDWTVYHRETKATHHADLNNSYAFVSDNKWDSTEPTASVFTVGAHERINYDTWTYVAYLFAGGESTAATARSVNQNPNTDYFQTSTGSDYTFGTGDFTIEGWFWPVTTNDRGLFMQAASGSTGVQSSYSFNCHVDSTIKYVVGGGSTQNTGVTLPIKQWSHVAFVRSSGVVSVYFNGTQISTASDTTNYDGTDLVIGAYKATNYLHDGKISNFRVVKGTAVYTSSFRPPTEPLTNITNTKLLCFNNSSTTGTTVGTITVAAGSPTASTDSPFDDPAAFTFGENGDQNVIKCGSYTGNETSGSYPKIDLGFEPQWVMIKRSSGTGNWYMWDTMRGFIVGGNSPYVRANANNAENNNYDAVQLTSTGFSLHATGDWINSNSSTYVYVAIRRPDGYVGKPAELGTGVFAMDVGNGSSTIPVFDSGFPVDFALQRKPASTFSTDVVARLTGDDYLQTNNSNAANDASTYTFDSNSGWCKDSGADSNFQSWMWKRHAGMDVVTYKGDDVHGRAIPHSMNAVPEMIWCKDRDSTNNWMVYHSGATYPNSNAADNYFYLNTTAAGNNSAYAWFDTTPTSTHVTVGASGEVNGNNKNFLMLLFSSISGISAVGSYSGSAGAGNAQSIGFSPRFIIIKRTNGSDPWMVFDTLRGINNSGDDKLLYLNSNDSQGTIGDHDWISISSTGFSLSDGNGATNTSGGSYIYYAHA